MSGLLISAGLQMYYFSLPQNAETFARLVIEGYQELKRLAAGEAVNAFEVTGYSGVRCPPEARSNAVGNSVPGTGNGSSSTRMCPRCGLPMDRAMGGAFYTGPPSPNEICHRCLHGDDLAGPDLP